MLDIPTLGLDLLSRTMTRCAESIEEAGELDDSLAILENCKFIIGQRPVLEGLSENVVELREREKDIQRSLMEADEVRRW